MKKLKLKKTTLRVFVLSLIIITPIIIPFVFMLSNQFSKYSLEEINNFNQDKVSQTVKNMDFFLNNLKTYGYKIYNDISVQLWLNAEKNDPFIQISVINTLQNYKLSQPFISNFYLINTRSKILYDFKNGNISLESFDDQNILGRIKNGSKEWYRYFDSKIGNKSYLTLILPSSPVQKSYYGYIVIFVDKDMLRSFFMLDSKNVGTEMFILDENGNSIIRSDGISEIPKLKVDQKQSNQGWGNQNVEYMGATWTVNYAWLKSQNWTLCSMNRLDNLHKHVDTFENKVIIYFLIFYVFLLIVVYWGFLRSYRPLDKISEQIQQRIGKKNNRDVSIIPILHNEFKLLQRNFQLFLDDSDRARDSMKKHSDIIREEYLRQWILQGRLDKSIKEYMESESHILSFSYLYLIVIRIDSYKVFCDENDFSSRKLMKFAIGNVANELITNESWGSESVDLGSDHVVLIVGKNEILDSHFLDVIMSISMQVLNLLKIPNSIASSKPFSADDDIRKVYDNVLELTMLKFLRGVDKVYLGIDYDEFVETVQHLPDNNIIEEIINTVRTGKNERLYTLMDNLFCHMQNLTYDSCKAQLTYIIYTIMKSFSHVDIVKQVSNIEHIIERFSTINEYRKWLKELLSDVANSINQVNVSERKDEIASEIVEYIKNHIHDPMLTHEDIARHLSLSYSYVRHIFKDVFKITLADYILNERVNLVKNLLLTTDIPVMSIAERAGFQSKSGFFTVFKKAVGCTPNEYRVNNRTR